MHLLVQGNVSASTRLTLRKMINTHSQIVETFTHYTRMMQKNHYILLFQKNNFKKTASSKLLHIESQLFFSCTKFHGLQTLSLTIYYYMHTQLLTTVHVPVNPGTTYRSVLLYILNNTQTETVQKM